MFFPFWSEHVKLKILPLSPTAVRPGGGWIIPIVKNSQWAIYIRVARLNIKDILQENIIRYLKFNFKWTFYIFIR